MEVLCQYFREAVNRFNINLGEGTPHLICTGRFSSKRLGNIFSEFPPTEYIGANITQKNISCQTLHNKLLSAKQITKKKGKSIPLTIFVGVTVILFWRAFAD